MGGIKRELKALKGLQECLKRELQAKDSRNTEVEQMSADLQDRLRSSAMQIEHLQGINLHVLNPPDLSKLKGAVEQAEQRIVAEFRRREEEERQREKQWMEEERQKWAQEKRQREEEALCVVCVGRPKQMLLVP